jgi:hypothetical protein
MKLIKIDITIIACLAGIWQYDKVFAIKKKPDFRQASLK